MEKGELKIDMDFLVAKGVTEYSDGDLIIMEGSGQRMAVNSVKLEMVTMAYCWQGKMRCDLNGTTVEIKEGDMLVCPPNAHINDCMASADYKSKIFGMSYKTIQKSLLMSREVWNILAYVARNPVIHLSVEQRETMAIYHHIIALKTKHPENKFYKQSMQAIFRGLFYEMADAIAPHMDDVAGEKGFRQGEVLFKRFIHLLVSQDGQERTVKGYAEKLCVTPKYLSTVCKEVSGKTALCWIHDYLAEAITQRLKYSDSSVKEIADSLGFPNLSFFGKFVKAKFGLSPKEYRHKLLAKE